MYSTSICVDPSPATWALPPVTLSAFRPSTVWIEKRHLHARVHTLNLWIIIGVGQRTRHKENSEAFVYLFKTLLNNKPFASLYRQSQMSRYLYNWHNYPILELSPNSYAHYSWDKQERKVFQETGAVIPSLHLYECTSTAQHWVIIHAGTTALHGQSLHFCPWWSRRLLPEQVTPECSVAFLGRPWCHAVTARAFLRAGHVTFHLFGSLSVILAGMLTSLMQLLMTHIWLLLKCWFNMNEIRTVILWEVWKLCASTT